jgi:hypothetical protein
LWPSGVLCSSFLYLPNVSVPDPCQL